MSSIGLFKLLLAPWLCKAVWAPLVDKYSTKHRWLLFSIGGLIVSCACGIFISPHQTEALSAVLLALNICAATQDIAVDAIAVALLAEDEVGKGNTAQVVGYKIGSVFGGGVLVWFIDALGWSGLFAALTILYVEAWMFVYVSPTLREFDVKMKREAAAREANFDYRDITDLKWEKLEDTSVFTDSSSESLFPEQSLRKRKSGNQFSEFKKYYKEDDVRTSDEDFPDSAKTLHARLLKKAKYRAKKARDDALRLNKLEDNSETQKPVCDDERLETTYENDDKGDKNTDFKKTSANKKSQLNEKACDDKDREESVAKKNEEEHLSDEGKKESVSAKGKEDNVNVKCEVESVIVKEESVSVKEEEESLGVESDNLPTLNSSSNDLFSKLKRRNVAGKYEEDSLESPREVSGSGDRSVHVGNGVPLTTRVNRRSQLSSEEYIADDEKDSSSEKDPKESEEEKEKVEKKVKKKEEQRDEVNEKEEEPLEGMDSWGIIHDDEEDEVDGLRFFKQAVKVPGTKWMILLILVYKLGE